MTYTFVEPLSLQAGQTVRVHPGEAENFVDATVVLVEGASGYVTVLATGTSHPVAFPASEWRFEVFEEPISVPQEDGIFVKTDEADAQGEASAILLRRNGEWTNLLGDQSVVIPEAEIPPVVPLRAIPANIKTQTPTTAPTGDPVQGSTEWVGPKPVIEEPAP